MSHMQSMAPKLAAQVRRSTNHFEAELQVRDALNRVQAAAFYAGLVAGFFLAMLFCALVSFALG